MSPRIIKTQKIMKNTITIKRSNAAKAAEETAKMIRFSDLSENEFYHLFIEGGEKAARHHLLMAQLADFKGKCPKCGKDLTYRHQSACTEKLVCPIGCGQVFPPATQRLAGDKPMYEVTLTKRKLIDGKWKDSSYPFNPFSKNGYKLPAVLFLTWGLIKDYIPSNIWDPKDRSRLNNFAEVKRIMTSLGINKFVGGNIGDQEITEIGQALVQLIKSPENGGVGKDFLGMVSVPKGVDLESEVDWPKSIFDSRINHKTAPTTTPKKDSAPASDSNGETDKDFLYEKDVLNWLSNSWRKEDPVRPFPPKGFEDALINVGLETNNPGILHLISEVISVAQHVASVSGKLISDMRKEMSVILDGFMDHKRAWNNFLYAITVYDKNPKTAGKAIKTLLESQTTPVKIERVFVRDKDLFKILREGPNPYGGGEPFWTVEGFIDEVYKRHHIRLSPNTAREVMTDFRNR